MLLHKILSNTLGFLFSSPPFLLCHFSQYGTILGKEMSEKSWVQGCAVAALPSVPEFLPNSLIITAIHAKHPIHSVVKYVTGIGDVHSSLCREGGTQVTFWPAQCAGT